jgi:hypothetical protein
MEELLKKYKDMAFDPNQPFASEIYHLYKTYPNDKELGEHVRKLMLRMEAHLKQKAEKKQQEDLEKIIKNGK